MAPSAGELASAGEPAANLTDASQPQQQQQQQQHTKLKPVNFTLVDEIFDAELSEDEVVAKWRRMDGQLQDGMRSILKMVFPQIVAISQDAKVSGDCSGGILKWILSLRNLRSWAIKMLDATGKPTAGIFEGSLTLSGNYRQCLAIRAPDEDEIEITEQFEEYFRGQFCVIHLKPWMPVKRPFYHLNSSVESLLRKNYKYYEKTLYDELAEIAVAFNFLDIRLDLCVPSTCTTADIQRVAELLSSTVEMRAKLMRCDVAPREPALAHLLQQLDAATLAWALAPLAFVALALAASLLLATRRCLLGQGQAAKRPRGRLFTALHCLAVGANWSRQLATTTTKPPSGGTKASLAAQRDARQTQTTTGASPPSNYHHQSATVTPISSFLGHHYQDHHHHQDHQDQQQEKPLALYGLRNLLVLWFIVVQMTVELRYQYLRESLTLRNMIMSYWPFQIIVNSSLVFESLILVTAFSFSYANLELSLRHVIGHLVDKYLRMLMPIVTLVALTITTPLLAIQSPVWRNFVDQQAQVCKSNGYVDLFFLQNFIPYDKICLPHTWLLCVELQLLVLAIPLVLLLNKVFAGTEEALIMGDSATESPLKRPVQVARLAWRRFASSKSGLLSLALVALGFILNFALVYTNQLPPSWFYTFPDVQQKNYYFGAYLTKTWTHLSVFMIGLLAGHLCRSIHILRNVQRLKTHHHHQQSSFPCRLAHHDEPGQQQQQQQPASSPVPSLTNTQSTRLTADRLAQPHPHQQRQQLNGSNCTIMTMERDPSEAPAELERGSPSASTAMSPSPASSSFQSVRASSSSGSSSSLAVGRSSADKAERASESDNGNANANAIAIANGNANENATAIQPTLAGPLMAPSPPPPANRARDGGGLSGALCQVAALICMPAIIFSTYSWSTQEPPSPLVSALYDSLSRIVWSLALVTLMIRMCLPDAATNRYSKLARLFGHPLCIVMGRLSLLAYLLSPYIHNLVLAVQEQSLFPSLFLIFHVIVGNIVIIYVLSFILAILVEQPIRQLFKQLLFARPAAHSPAQE